MRSSDRPGWLAPGCEMPFCKGCGHAHVVRALDAAVASLGLAPADVCLVTDIGCVGLADAVFEGPHSVHTTHGRSTAFATGMALADRVLAGGRLKPIVLIGDGGATIGLLHLVQAALLNTDVTVLLCNNFLFGMTGGQHSAFSPLGFVTSTSPGGTLTPPLDVCRIVQDSHAGFVARHLATDRDLAATVARAIRHPGFALVEVVEICTAHAPEGNAISTAALRAAVGRAGQAFGVWEREGRPEFGEAWAAGVTPGGPPEADDAGIPVDGASGLEAPVGVVVAGSAGERVQSAAYRLGRAAARAGLYVTQRNDNPVTQGTGFSIAEVVLSPREILYAGIDAPDLVLAVSEAGLREVVAQGIWDRLSPAGLALVDASLTPPPTRARVVREPFRRGRDGSGAAARAIARGLDLTGILPAGAFEAAGA